MGSKLRKATFSVLLAALSAVVLAPPAEARRGTPPDYVPQPQYDQNPHPLIPDEADPDAGEPSVEPTVVPVDLPAVADPGANLAGGGERLDPAPSDVQELDRSESRPEAHPSEDDGFMGGILSRTGAETLPLARAGLAALALGVGLVVLTRRRGADPASA